MISVIMLTYNREKYISKMIEDILRQTFQDFEYIIIDNGSADNSGSIAEKYAASDSRIRVIHLDEPKSIGYARNLGLKMSKGNFIAYVDDDDRAKPDYLEFLFKLINEYNADISICGTTEGDGVTENPQCISDVKKVITGEEALILLLKRKYIRAGTAAKMYRRKILERYPFEENYKNEDVHTQYKYLSVANRIAMHEIDKYYIVRHADNVSGFTDDSSKWNKKIMNDYLVAYHNRSEFVREHNPNVYNLALYTEWAFMISMIEKIERYDLRDCRELGGRMAKVLSKNVNVFKQMPEIKDFELEWIERYVG